MKLTVYHTDAKKKTSTKLIYLSKLAFAKHMAISGQSFLPMPHKIMRTLGMFLHYNLYTRNFTKKSSRFSEPPTIFSDPTEKGHFSNLAGKAIADYLSKRLDNSALTLTYEAAMKVVDKDYRGPRPDLIAFDLARRQTFTIEAKGYSGNCGNMLEHKKQASSGSPKIVVNFSVAAVSFHIYDSIKTNYCDPILDNSSINEEMLRELSKQYYSGLLSFIENDNNSTIINVNGTDYFKVNLIPTSLIRKSKIDTILDPYSSLLSMPTLQNFSLILPANIYQLASVGMSVGNSIQAENHVPQYVDTPGLYIDNDGVGLSYNRLV
ncbi:hypothetical protein KB206_10245 [Microvirga sp. STS02]|uniref:hypothetical protein n=1 Tax=Hymenobacter negativus TaxID=2795026 RepID=UPI0018DB110D|nr:MULTISPECIES: hypothetical protein [Bacteria]MBH8569265.1 hypothetical protein [Hymenobacter negativus]MBR7209000.1 hypothetical protein [Microvirga sp. STS02]